MKRFGTEQPNGVAVQQFEVLVRTAIFKPANALVGWLLQAAADRIDAACQPKPGQQRKGRQTRQVQGLFGSFPLTRDYCGLVDPFIVRDLSRCSGDESAGGKAGTSLRTPNDHFTEPVGKRRNPRSKDPQLTSA
jgi:hypothetical protein